ncbi:hypothetical protein D6029_08250 [Buttiauxella izardii]|uniref:Uncharacterized protein n=1 Tax=Buttiauxella izardii TaxID=82991 RepID=A0A3A5JZZ4_9ENTR|nr:hypothetical protein D6029_08250 [Buttiauxella izardii]
MVTLFQVVVTIVSIRAQRKIRSLGIIPYSIRFNNQTAAKIAAHIQCVAHIKAIYFLFNKKRYFYKAMRARCLWLIND